MTSTTWSGAVPHVTIGESEAASTSTSASNCAPSSVGSSRHRSSAASKSRGAPARPSTHSNVVSSGAIMPARPPPSIVMLQIVMRFSIVSAPTVSPAYSTAWPTMPPVPRRPIVARIMSFAVTPLPSSPE